MTVHENVNVRSPFFLSCRSKTICSRKSAHQILKTININMETMSWKSLPDWIVLCYGTNVIDDLQFILLYDYSQSRLSYPYQKYNQFNLEIFDEAQCFTEFCFTKRDTPWLSDALQLPRKIVCCQGTVANNIEAMRILLTHYMPKLPSHRNL